MRKQRHIAAFITGLLGAAVVNPLALPRTTDRDSLNGTIWAANRGTHTIRAFDADSGAVVRTVNMSANSQPGDLAYAKGKLYVAEEFGTPPAIAIVDAETGTILSRIFTASSSRPHHVHASAGGNLIAVGLFGTDTVAVVDTHNDTLLGPWDSNPIDDERPGPRGGVLERRKHAVPGERRLERGHRDGPAHRIRVLAPAGPWRA